MDSHETPLNELPSNDFHDAVVYLLQEYLTHGLYRKGVQAWI